MKRIARISNIEGAGWQGPAFLKRQDDIVHFGYCSQSYQIIVADAADAVSVNFSGRCKFLQI